MQEIQELEVEFDEGLLKRIPSYGLKRSQKSRG
jgi:hypothetical protein